MFAFKLPGLHRGVVGARHRGAAATRVPAAGDGGRKREAGGGADKPRPRRRKMFRVKKQGGNSMKERRVPDLISLFEVSVTGRQQGDVDGLHSST